MNNESTPGPSPAPAPQTTFQLGGQALIEGVMMRSPRYVAGAVRHPDGTIETKVEMFQSITKRHKWLGLPFLRGVVGMFEMLSLGMRYLNWSGNIALQAENDKKKAEANIAAGGEMSGGDTPGDGIPGAAATSGDTMGGDTLAGDTRNDIQAPGANEAPSATSAMVVAEPPVRAEKSAPDALPLWTFILTATCSFGIGLLLFVALPNLITDWTLKRITNNLIALNTFEGAVKLAIFVAYIWLIGRRPDIRRVFEFHGAEHKVVYAVENDRPLTPEGARPFDTPHPRCGTGFALLTVFVSIICFVFLPWPEEHWIRVGWRFLLMPVVAGVSYEIIKLTIHPRWKSVAQLILTPGMWLQRLTTNQPDDVQLEVACVAMRAVLEAEHSDSAVAGAGTV